ncbi:hypothetical protein R1sor_020343 [Riccia sorocarpa]|uniref:Reverse transcriptase domain-containing protein n=1 Tax=Riccia sorocarpa TaxID=122646 RepID=A0ABD3IFU7_9MARC
MILVQLDYEGLHLRCFKCSSLDHKAEDCESTGKAEGQQGVAYRTKGKVDLDSADTSSSSDLRSATKHEEKRSQTPVKERSKITKAQGTEVLIGRKLWKGESSKLKDQSRASTAGEETTKQDEVTTEGRSERTPTKQQPYRPPASRTPQPSSASKRKQRSISDSEGGEEGRTSKQARSKGPIHKLYGAAPSFAPAPVSRPAIQKGVIHQSEVKRPQNLRLRDWKSRARQGKIVAAPATDGIHANANPTVTAGKDGVALAFSRRLSEMVTDSGNIMDRAVWAHIEGLQMGQVGIIAIYAPNSAAERTHLWERITSTLDTSRAWIALGDFNMIINEADQVGRSFSGLAAAEKEAWETMITELRLGENFERKPEGRWFSWDNLHRRREVRSPDSENTSPLVAPEQDNSIKILKRLDRVYLSEELKSRQKRYEILDNLNRSDHAPVLMVLEEGTSKEVQKARFCMNSSLLKDELFKVKVMETWKDAEDRSRAKDDDPEVTLKKCLRRVKKEMRQKGKEVARERRAWIEEKRGRIKQLTIKLQKDPQNQEIQVEIQEVKAEAEEKDLERARWIQQKLDMKWIINRDVPSRVFFSLFKVRQKQLQIECLADEEEREIKDTEEMCKMAESHFRGLLTEEKAEEERIQDISHILGMVKNKLEPAEREAMELPLSEEEIKDAADCMKRGKSPGPDGATVEFFVTMWETVGEMLAKVLIRGANEGRFPAWVTPGDVVLLPKPGDPRLLGNKWPITLLNTVYKIYTKALQRRLVPILQRIIGWNQSAFLPDRSIHTSVLTCNEAIHTAKRSGQDHLLLQLDFRKAFDSVNWSFLMKAMEALNFGPRFCGYIRAILETAASSIIVNGRRSKPVKVTRSVRQGCPLSPLLFILVTQTLTDAVDEAVKSASVQGIYLQPANTHYCLGLYADDLHVIFRATEEGATNVRDLLDKYANATGLKIQWNKSVVSCIGPNSNNKPEWVKELA